MDALVHDHPRARHAGLPGRGEDARDDAVGRGGQVGVLEDDLRGLAAQLKRHPVEVVRRGVRDGPARRRRAGERDLVDALVLARAAPSSRLESGDDVEDAVREARLVEHLGEGQGRGGGMLGGLHHERAARGEAGRELERHQQQRGVPRRDRADDADRLAAGEAEVVGLVGRDDPALDLVGVPGEVLYQAPSPCSWPIISR